MGFLGTLGSIARTAWKLGGILLPFLKAIRGSVSEIDAALTIGEDTLDAGGEVADDWFDANIDTIRGIKVFGEGLADVGIEVSSLADRIITASQVDSPDTITVEEAAVIGERIWRVKAKIQALIAEMGALEAGLEKMA